jgi:hypothetical protein
MTLTEDALGTPKTSHSQVLKTHDLPRAHRADLFFRVTASRVELFEFGQFGAEDEVRLRCSEFAEGAWAFGCRGKTRPGLCFERARLYRLRKSSIQGGFVTGHGFSRADKANQMSRALAPAKAHSSS